MEGNTCRRFPHGAVMLTLMVMLCGHKLVSARIHSFTDMADPID
jgi:hypothetical protein